MKSTLDIVVPVYKKLDLFEKMAKNNLKYLFPNDRLIIVNDCPEDDLTNLVKSLKMTNIILIQDGVNRGFAGACNRGVGEVKSEQFFLINSDVKLISSSFHELLGRFEKDESIFSISLGQIEKNGELVGGNELYWDGILMQHRGVKVEKERQNGWGEGGSSIFSTKKWRQLGGFDEILNPFYWEDVELGMRVSERGWKNIFVPSFQLEHHHESTIKSFNSDEKITLIAMRNQLISNWKNLPKDKLLNHLIRLPFKLLRSAIGDRILLRGFFEAVKRKLFYNF